jgi:hypothetical protein
LTKWSGNKPGGLPPNFVGNQSKTVPVLWKHRLATKICNLLMGRVVENGPVWRGEMLCSKSVQTDTLPRKWVEEVFKENGIVDQDVEKQGLSLYYPGGREAFEKQQGGIHSLVMGVARSHSAANPCNQDISQETSLGTPGCMPPA